MTGLYLQRHFALLLRPLSITVLLTAMLIHLAFPLDVNGKGGENIKFSHITVEDGLSHHETLFVLQDSQGFLWFGTKHGLNKYDGMNVTSFFHDSENPNSLCGNFAHWIHEDRDGALWIATWGDGISKYDPKSGEFTNYHHEESNPQTLGSDNVWSLYVDRNGLVWCATDGGLSKFNPEMKTFVRYRHDPKNANSLSNNTVSRVSQDDQGIIWISTYGGGLDRFDPETETFTNYKHRHGDSTSLSNNNLWSVYIDTRKRIWIGSEEGLNKFNPETETFTSYQHDKTDHQSISSNTVTFIYEDRAGMLWLGTFGGGVNRFDPEQETFVHYHHDTQDPHSLSNGTIMSIYEDTTGAIWVATFDGINKYDSGENQFEHYNDDLSNAVVRSIYQDENGSVWIGTGGGGLNHLNKARTGFVHYLHDKDDPNSISDNDIWAISQDKRGDLWIGTHESGMNRFDPEQGTFVRYKHDPHNSNTVACDAIYDLAVDEKRDVLWIASYLSGLDKYDIAKETFTHYLYDAGNPDGIVSNWSTAVFVDSKGFVWVGTEAGLSRFNPETELFTNFKHNNNDPGSLSGNMIQSIYEDSRGIIWIGTNNGLSRYDASTQIFDRYSEMDGLVSNRVASITEDNEGYLWISTDKGISKFNTQSETFRNYDQRDGLQGGRFLMHSAHRNEEGELFFGGTNGFNVFHPNELTDNQHIPRIVFTDFQLFNQPVQVGEDSPLTQHINQSQQIILEHHQSVFSIAFAALNYRNSQKNQYAYMMEGFDRDFTYADSDNRSVTYTNLDPGRYTFRVKASNNDGLWNEEGASIEVLILPPWWETSWFYSVMVLLALAIIFAVAFYVVKLRKEIIERKQAEEKLLEKSKQLKASNQQLIASEQQLRGSNQHTNALNQQLEASQKELSLKNEELQSIVYISSHDLKTPLVNITGFSEMLIEHCGEMKELVEKCDADADTKKEITSLLNDGIPADLDYISTSTERMKRLIEGLLQVSRIGTIEIETKNINMKDVLSEIIDNVKYKTEDLDTEIAFEDLPDCTGDKGQITQVFTNLIDNALNYLSTDRKGRIRITGKAKNNESIYCIEDNGIGINPAYHGKVFEIYHRLNPRASTEGDGLGLTIVRRILDRHKGRIWLQSEPEKGSKFFIAIPTK